MKRLFNTNLNLESTHLMLLVIRIAVAAFMLTHGYPKLQKLLAGGEIQFGDPIGVGVHTSLVLAVFAEFVCSILIFLGLATRLATLPLIVTMAIAVFIVHAADPFVNKELGLLYLLIYLVLLVVGAGKYSIDQLISRNSHRRRR